MKECMEMVETVDDKIGRSRRREVMENGWYKTGDQGVLREDGYLTISGRSKDSIIRGKRKEEKKADNEERRRKSWEGGRESRFHCFAR